MGYKKFLGMGYKKFLGPGSSEWVTRNSWEKLSTFSLDFPVKDSLEFPWIFSKIVTWDVTGLLTKHTLYLHLYRSDHLIILPSLNLKYYSSVALFICSFELLAAAIGT